MPKLVFAFIVFGLLITTQVKSQESGQQGIPGYSYYPPNTDKESWQRLYLLLSSTFINVANEGQVDLDSCLFAASRSLGLSRFSVLAEGFGDQELFKESQWLNHQDPGTGIRLLSNSKEQRRLQLLLLLGSYYAFQRDSYHRFKDSVAYFLDKAKEESLKLKQEKFGRQALCLLGKIYVQVNDSKGDSIFNLLITQCKEAGDEETEAKAFMYRSRYTPPMPTTLQRKTNDAQQAANLYHSLGNAEGEINALTDLGYLITITGQLEAAKEIFLKALKLAETIHFPYTHYNAQTLSMITSFQGKFGEPLRYALQMIKVSESCRDSIGWGYFHSTLALLLKAEGREKESQEIMQKAIDRFVRDHNPTVYNVLVDLINLMDRKKQAREALGLVIDISKKVNKPESFADQFSFHHAFAICYLNANRLDMAEMHLSKMISLEAKAAAIRGPLRSIEINELSGLFLMKKGQYREARELFEKRFTTASMINRPLNSDLEVYRRLIYLDSILNDNVSALSHYKKYVLLLDSSFNVTKVRQAEELQVMYQIQEKEDQISLLTKQAKLEKDNLQKAALVRNLTIAGIVAALIIALLLYRQNRSKQKANQMITRKNEQLQDLLIEKQWLLKEIHHRVKNNLQIVMSLLNSQSAYISNDAALTAIHDSQRRVNAMALIHQKLYLSENISFIPMPDYINQLVHYISDSFDTGNRIVFQQQIEPLELDVSQAIPLGLIINECISNSIKYAFPGERNGIVGINLRRDGDDYLLLTITDNGIGLANDTAESRHDSLGLDLIRGLSKQLNGSLTIENNNGVKVSIRFVFFNEKFNEISVVHNAARPVN